MATVNAMHDHQTASKDASPLQPLTRRKKKDGAPYVRPNFIEQEIIAALDRPLAHLLRSSAPASNGCLVYFARHFPSGALIEALLERAKRVVGRHVGHIPAHRRPDVHERVRDEFLARLVSGTDVLDIYEAQFDRAIRALTTDAIRRFVRQDQLETAAEAFASTDDDAIATDALDRQLFKSQGPQMSEAEVRVELVRVRALLTDKEYRAMYAHHVLGLDIESIDANQTTVATLMGVSGRQIRTYLKSAITKVAKATEDSR